jgi:NADH-quinone oxidoreductase subunit C
MSSGSDTAAAAGVAGAEDAAEADAPRPEPEELLHGVPTTTSRGQVVLHPAVDGYVDLVGELRQEGYWVCVDLCGVDYLGSAADRGLPASVTPERFELVVNLLDHRQRRRIRLRLQVPESDPVVPTLFHLHPTVEAHERETWDLFGIRFEGHPDLTRILLPDEWEGHPLRKDYAVGRIPVQFKGAPAAR